MTLAQIEQSYEMRDERLHGQLPDNFKYSGGDVTAPEIDVHLWLNYLSSERPMWEFCSLDKRVCSKKPVAAKVTKGESLYLAENENLGIFVAEESLEAVIKAFEEEVVHFYFHYRSLGPERVMGEAKKLWNLYNEQFDEAAE